MFESLALRLLAIGAQVLGLGALDGVATNLMGVVSAYLMGVVALGGIRPVATDVRLRYERLLLKQISFPLRTQLEANGAPANDPAGLGWQRRERYRPAL